MKFVLVSFLFFTSLFASNCKDTLFAFDIPSKSSKVKIIDIVENMASECRFSVKIQDDSVKEQLDKILYLVHIENYTLKDMFDFLFTQNNIFYKYDDDKNVLTISYLETKSFVVDYVNLSQNTTTSTKNINVGTSSSTSESSTSTSDSGSTSSDNYDSTTVVSSSEFKFWNNLSKEIDDILYRDGDYSVESKSIINKDAGIITITGTHNQIQRIDKYLKKIKDRMHKQVTLEVKLVEVTYTDTKNKGIDWSKFDLAINGDANTNSWATLVNSVSNNGGSSDASIAYNFSMSGLINFLDSYGDVNVLSTPKIMTLNNQPAVINVGDQRNYEYLVSSVTNNDTTGSITNNTYGSGSTFIGLTLNIVPEITEAGYIILRINPVISERIDDLDVLNNTTTSSVSTRSAPDIRIKQLSSIVKAKNRSRVVIGGLVSYSNDVKTTKVAGLGDIPILGYAFKHESKEIVKKELIIVITPTIIDYNKFPSIDSIEASMSEYEDD